MLKVIHKILSMINPRQRLWVVIITIISTTVVSFIPNESIFDKVISLYDKFTYDDSEMKTQLKLQKQRLKELVLINDSLNSELLSQSMECTEELMDQNETFRTKLIQIQSVFQEHEKEENNLNNNPKSYRIVVREKDMVRLKYDTIFRESYEERQPIVLESVTPDDIQSEKKKSWFGWKKREKLNETLMTAIYSEPPTPKRILIKKDTIYEPRYVTHKEVKYDTFEIHLNKGNTESNESLKKLKKLIEVNLIK